jgi:hypothetical protein
MTSIRPLGRFAALIGGLLLLGALQSCSVTDPVENGAGDATALTPTSLPSPNGAGGT